MAAWWEQWNPGEVVVNATTPDDAWKVCVIQGVYFGENEYNGNLGGRISAIFVIFATSFCTTLFPVLARRIKRLRIPEMVYMIAKMFGSGVIVTTAFVHLMDPAYSEIGPNTCVGMTGQWASYSWNAGIMLASAVGIFLVDAYCDFLADIWYDVHSHLLPVAGIHDEATNHVHSHDIENSSMEGNVHPTNSKEKMEPTKVASVDSVDIDYHSQFAGFLVLEFGVLLHSVMIGLTLGSSEEYGTLYPVLVFHQAFEGLGIGSRLSTIPFPRGKKWVPYACCVAYSLTTPIAIAIGLGVRDSYRDSSYTAQVVQGVLDSISAGILMYTGFVELLARDFIFNPHRTKKIWELNLQLFVFLWGAGLMALLGKWA